MKAVRAWWNEWGPHVRCIEIKSSKDSLDRLEKQMTVFRANMPEVWLAMAPKWLPKITEGRTYWYIDKIVVDDTEVREPWGRTARIDRAITVQLLRMLWKSELLAIGARTRIIHQQSKADWGALVATLARMLTGQEIITQACTELRARAGGMYGPAFGIGSDKPVRSPP